MTTRKKTTVRTHKCGVKHIFGCNGVGVRQYVGRHVNDPKFYACMGCAAMLRRGGARFTEVTDAKKRNSS